MIESLQGEQINISSWRIRRAILGLRQRDVADRAHTSQSKYSMLERGETSPTAGEIEAIDRVLALPDAVREKFQVITASPGIEK